MERRQDVDSFARCCLARLAVVCLFLSFGGRASHGVTLDDLQRAFAVMESSIKDVTVEYDWYRDPPATLDEIVGTGHLRSVSRAHKSLATAIPFSERQLSSTTVDLEDEYGHRFTARYSRSYNGTVVKAFHNNIGPKVHLEGTITKRTDILDEWLGSPMGFTILRDYPKLLSEEIAKNPKSSRIEEDIQKVNGFNTICLALLWPDGAVYKRIYLSVDHGYAPVRFAYIRPGSGEMILSVEVLSLKEASKGIWFPMKGNIPDSNNFYEAKSVLLNRGLPIEYFDIQFPPGTRINDEIAGVQYVAGPEGSASAEQGDVGATGQGSRQGGVPLLGLRWLESKWLWASGAILLGILLLVVFMRRRSVRHASGPDKGE